MSTDVDVRESEDELVTRAQTSVSQCNWTVGECAAKWTRKYARGRTDADFGAMVGLSSDQVYQRRRVWETFADVQEDYSSLRWSHFYVALTWEDAAECLGWAQENSATVAEMKAWRRMQRGEDLTTPSEEDAEDGLVAFLPSEPTEVRDPGERAPQTAAAGGESSRGSEPAREPAETVSGVHRENGSRGEAEAETTSTTVAERPEPSTEQVIKRITGSLERMTRALTPEVREDFERLPKKVRARFVKAVSEFSSQVADFV